MKNQILNDKLELIQWLSSLEDQSIIKKLVAIRNNDRLDWWNDLSPNEKNEIEIGLSQIAKGETVSHKNVMKQFEKWK
jgi:hypothetical protein